MILPTYNFCLLNYICRNRSLYCLAFHLNRMSWTTNP